jgi:glycosyltransferase involved in cell wall biosynthesis
MKVSGFTFVRNAVQYDYPVVEAIQSILPLCDEIVVAVGNSSDETLALIKSIPSPKIRIINTVWDDSLRKDGKILAVETDKAFRAIAQDSDWAFYIQGDEVIHEKYLQAIRQAMVTFKDDPDVDGLLFKYLHFYGSYNYIAKSSRWYRNEIRIIKNNPRFFSYKDAQGFRKKPNEKLKVKAIDACVYHYGHVREPEAMQRKHVSINRFWHSDEWIDRNIKTSHEYEYATHEPLSLFHGTHPGIMATRISIMNWKFVYNPAKERLTLKERIKTFFERFTGWRPGEYKNYKLIKSKTFS